LKKRNPVQVRIMTTHDTKPNVHQFVPVLESGDAIGNHALAIQGLLRKLGYQSDIFAWRAGKGMKGYCRNYLHYAGKCSERDVLIYHFGVSSPITGFFVKAPGRKVIIYHNITPEHFYRGVNDKIFHILKKGRQELASIASKVDCAMADSEYNREELMTLGFRNTVTIPLLMDFNLYDATPDDSIMRRYKDGKANIIFVGRISPNKKQEDIIRAFSVYRKYINQESRLFIIGQNHQVPEYNAILNKLISTLGVKDILLTGGVSQSELNAYYGIADLFLCMSEHEGFCIPLLESMHFGIPILAYESTAVIDTLDGAGVLFGKKDLGQIAEMMDILVKDHALKEKIVRRQKGRLRRFQRETIENEFLNNLSKFLN
jgi:L-malate glycosyltransferase